MKISKNKTKSQVVSSKETPRQHIKAAIELLSKSAKTDPAAKAAIADLGVVLLTLN